MTFLSYAQNFEDVMLWRALKSIPDGFYVDVGASHPDHDSVTRALYDRGWRGINIEPVTADFRRLEAARLRDININVALGESPGAATLYTVPGTGLSTLETDGLEAISAGGFEIQSSDIEVQTLAQVCRSHAPETIHFLKIDVEGSERSVLAGADFTAYRPWIVLVEATAPMSTAQTHVEWELLLTTAGYHAIWFDGLNRFYVADEKKTVLEPFFQTPPNVFDDFIRVCDSAVAQQLATAQAVAGERVIRCELTEKSLAAALTRTALALEQRRDAIDLQKSQAAELSQLHAQAESARQAAAEVTHLRALLQATHVSTSWRVTAPLRYASRLLRRRAGAAPGKLAAPPMPPPEPMPKMHVAPKTKLATQAGPRRGGPIRTVHQFHAGSATGDAITNAMLLTRALLRSHGYRSEIFVAHRDPALSGELLTIDELPPYDDYILLLHHSMGFDAFDQIVALKAVKILIYHNITPPEYFANEPFMQAYCRLGRVQLQALRPLVSAALADSEYNAIELRSLGFESVQACTMLFDLAGLRRRARPHMPSGIFTIIFVGRVVEAKGQLDLVEAFRHFRGLFKAPCRLILIGHCDYGSDYVSRLEAEALAPDLRSHVIITGPLSDADRDAYYAAADLYVSLSKHEGFGVPLVEAMVNGVPVLAWPSGAVPYTLGNGGAQLTDASPVSVARHMLAVARDPAGRARMVRAQYQSLQRFDGEIQTPILLQAVARAGGFTHVEPAVLATLRAHMQFEVTGHLTSSYSLALVNRTLALALDETRPGKVRVVPIAGEADRLEAGLPAAVRARLLALVARDKPHTGPVVVISHHYPLHVPDARGDVLLALFFWEESVVPQSTIAQLNGSFSGVIAPSRAVAKALVDSGLSIPVFPMRYFPNPTGFAAIRGEAATGEVFTFLHISSCFPRKGVDVLLAAYAACFDAGDKVRLVIKGFPNPHNDVEAQITALLAGADADIGEIVFINRDMDDAELVSLYAQADIVVLPARGEGFNLPAAEALAAGIPVIVTGHGGHMDFCGTADVRLLDYQFTPAGSHVAGPHSLWVEPAIDDLSAALREAFARGRRGAAAVGTSGPAVNVTEEIRKLEEFALQLLVTPLPEASVAWISSWGVACGIAGYSEQLISHLPRHRISRITILTDDRTETTDGESEVIQAWRLGDPTSLPRLMAAVTRADPDVTVIQHHPGLMGWDMLTELLTMLAAQRRVVTVTLHNSQKILELAPHPRAELVAALGRTARVIVHTVADVNRMKSLGLIDNVVMIPHGAAPPGSAKPVGPLTASDDALIGCYGFFLPGKGLPELIESFAILRRTWPNLRLRLVNADYGTAESAAEISACNQLARDMGLEHAIEFCTAFLPTERSMALLGACDIVVLAHQSSSEAASGSAHTALAAGAPVMVTPLPLFDAFGAAVRRFSGISPVDMAAGISCLLADPVQRAHSQQAVHVWAETHSWACIATRTHGLILGLSLHRPMPN